MATLPEASSSSVSLPNPSLSKPASLAAQSLQRSLQSDKDRTEASLARYDQSLSSALHQFRSLLGSASSRAWKPLLSSSTQSDSTSTNEKGKARDFLDGLSAVEASQVVVHKRAVKGGPDVVRAVVEINTTEGVDLDSFKAVLQTPELRSQCKQHLPLAPAHRRRS